MTINVAGIPEPISPARLLLEIWRLAFSDPRRLVDADGELRHVANLDDDTAAALQHVETLTRADGTTRVIGAGFYDKSAALKTLMKYLSVHDAEALEAVAARVREVLVEAIASESRGEARH